MSRLLELEGPSALLPALEAVIDEEQGLDLVVIRDFVTNPDLLKSLDDGSGERRTENVAQLYEAIPSLPEADNFVKDRWRKIGYVGLEPAGKLHLDQWRARGILPHLDELVYRDSNIEIIAQGSLCIKGVRRFSAERLDEYFTHPDGTLDMPTYDARVCSIFEEVWNQGRTPRTQAMVSEGDAVFFAHHPTATLHGVSHDDGQTSIARLLSWNASKV